MVRLLWDLAAGMLVSSQMTQVSCKELGCVVQRLWDHTWTYILALLLSISETLASYLFFLS